MNLGVNEVEESQAPCTFSLGHGVYIRTYPGGHAVLHAPGKLLFKGDEYIDLNPAMPNAETTIEDLLEGDVVDSEIRIHSPGQPTKGICKGTGKPCDCGSKTREREDDITD